MMKIGLIIGFGSIGQQHYQAMKNTGIFKKIYILSEHYKNENSIHKLEDIEKIKPDLVIICSETSKHFNQLRYIESKLKNKIILVEKPIFTKKFKFTIKNNKVFVGYNLRYDPVLQYLKKILKNKNILITNITCTSYLPNWRKRDYKKLYSASKLKGGGVHLDLSHEIDYANWIFNNLKKIDLRMKKLSNLKINSYDYTQLICTSNKSKFLNINLNYFSKKNQRYIEIYTNKEFIFVDLINRKVELSNFSKKQIKKFDNISSVKRMSLQIKDIIKNKPIYACSYNEALQVLSVLGV